jgi:hypothetical protein
MLQVEAPRHGRQALKHRKHLISIPFDFANLINDFAQLSFRESRSSPSADPRISDRQNVEIKNSCREIVSQLQRPVFNFANMGKM